MALGDGSNWDETVPTNATLAVLIDDYDRDLRVGVRSRMALEHEWPGSQSATNQGGQHKFVTMQNQATKPTVSGTQLAAIYTKTVGSGLQEMYWENEAGTEVQVTNRGILNVGAGTPIQTIRKSMAAATSGSGSFAVNDTIPATSNGFAVVALSTGISPLFATSRLQISFHVNWGKTAGELQDPVFVAVSRSGTSDCDFIMVSEHVSNTKVGVNHAVGNYEITSAGTTGAMNFQIRVGDSAGNGMTINGSAGSRLWGGANISFIQIQEIKV